jgi:protein TonB
MTTTFAAQASRQTVILTVIAGLHLGAFVLIASGLVPRVASINPPDAPIRFFPPKEDPIAVVRPVETIPFEDYTQPVPKPDDALFPKFDETPDAPQTNEDTKAGETGSGPVNAAVEHQPPTVRTRDIRLAALIDACYPAGARRAGEEGRVVAKVMIDASGKAAAWSVAGSSGFPRLDAALDCVIRRIEFVAGRRDGSAVAAEAMLPIVFRLN